MDRGLKRRCTNDRARVAVQSHPSPDVPNKLKLREQENKWQIQETDHDYVKYWKACLLHEQFLKTRQHNRTVALMETILNLPWVVAQLILSYEINVILVIAANKRLRILDVDAWHYQEVDIRYPGKWYLFFTTAKRWIPLLFSKNVEGRASDGFENCRLLLPPDTDDDKNCYAPKMGGSVSLFLEDEGNEFVGVYSKISSNLPQIVFSDHEKKIRKEFVEQDSCNLVDFDTIKQNQSPPFLANMEIQLPTGQGRIQTAIVESYPPFKLLYNGITYELFPKFVYPQVQSQPYDICVAAAPYIGRIYALHIDWVRCLQLTIDDCDKVRWSIPFHIPLSTTNVWFYQKCGLLLGYDKHVQFLDFRCNPPFLQPIYTIPEEKKCRIEHIHLHADSTSAILWVRHDDDELHSCVELISLDGILSNEISVREQRITKISDNFEISMHQL